MKSFIFYCNYCNAKLDVASDLENTDIVCPVCNKTITPAREMPDAPVADPSIPDAPVPDAPAFGKPGKSASKPPVKKDTSENVKKQYPRQQNKSAGKVLDLEAGSAYKSGRRYCLITRLTAAVVLVLGIVMSLRYISECKSDIKNHPLRVELEQQKNIFEKYEKDLIKLFSDAVIVIPEAAGGLPLSEKDITAPDLFSGNLEDPPALQFAREIVDSYRKKIAELKRLFRKKFLAEGKKTVPGIISAAPSGIIKVSTGKRNIFFYTNNAAKELELIEFEKNLQQYKSTVKDAGTLRLIAMLEKLCFAFKYQLIRGGAPVLTTTVTHSAGEKSAAVKNPGVQLKSIDFLLENWWLDECLNRMENLLDAAAVNVHKFVIASENIQRNLYNRLLALWVRTALICLALLMLAEFLRAVFDIADAQRRILSYKGLEK